METHHGRTRPPGQGWLFSRIGKMFGREGSDTPVDDAVEQNKAVTLRSHRYLVSVRRGITTFDDAMEAAFGL